MANTLPPPPIQEEKISSFLWQEWFRQLRSFLAGASGLLPWNNVDKTGSNLTDLVTRNHANLQSIQGGAVGEYYHLTSAQKTGLTGSGDTTLHYHSADRNRANHTGTQLAATISDLSTTIDGHVFTELQTVQTPVTSVNTTTHKVPIVLNGTTYYILLSDV